MMSHSRHYFGSSTPTPATGGLNAVGREEPLRASGAVTGFDGTVLATISCHTEPHPSEHPGSPTDVPLVVIDVVGDLDADTAPLLRAALTHAISRNPRVCCDLSQTRFIGAAAVDTLFAALNDADDTGCAFHVRGVHGSHSHVFKITGLDAVLGSRAGTLQARGSRLGRGRAAGVREAHRQDGQRGVTATERGAAAIDRRLPD
jgi:anti-anti-sigma factor